MKVIETPLSGVKLIEPRVFGDERGFFLETFRETWLAQAGIEERFVQDNHSRSRRGVLRGLHYQLVNPQGKLIRVARGRVFDVAVDIRRGSPAFCRWYGIELDDIAHRMLYIPPGFAHGFLVLTDEADFLYKCTSYYHAESDHAIAWNDPAIGIEWPDAGVAPIVSAKDAQAPRLADQPPDQLLSYRFTGTRSADSTTC